MPHVCFLLAGGSELRRSDGRVTDRLAGDLITRSRVDGWMNGWAWVDWERSLEIGGEVAVWRGNTSWRGRIQKMGGEEKGERSEVEKILRIT